MSFQYPLPGLPDPQRDHGKAHMLDEAENLSWLRKLALCLLKAEKTSKGKSIRRRLLAGWKDEYLQRVLAQIPEISAKNGA